MDEHSHEGLIEGQATIATELVGINGRLKKIETILTGPDGISGLVGWRNETHGRATLWGALGGASITGIVLAIRYFLRT